MKSNKRTLSILPALALMAVGTLGSVVPASAQSIFASPQAARSAGVSSYTQSPTRYTPNDVGSGTNDGTPADDPYTAIFGQIQTAVTGIVAGPGAKAFGILILGLAFGIAWRLVTKGTKTVAK